MNKHKLFSNPSSTFVRTIMWHAKNAPHRPVGKKKLLHIWQGLDGLLGPRHSEVTELTEVTTIGKGLAPEITK